MANGGFRGILEGVVLAISGLENPERGEVRERAVAMGARYRPDWTDDCTLLLAVFKGAPKVRRVVQANGTVVHKDWVHKCFEARQMCAMEPFLIHSGKPWRQSQGRARAPGPSAQGGTIHGRAPAPAPAPAPATINPTAIAAAAAGGASSQKLQGHVDTDLADSEQDRVPSQKRRPAGAAAGGGRTTNAVSSFLRSGRQTPGLPQGNSGIPGVSPPRALRGQVAAAGDGARKKRRLLVPSALGDEGDEEEVEEEAEEEDEEEDEEEFHDEDEEEEEEDEDEWIKAETMSILAREKKREAGRGGKQGVPKAQGQQRRGQGRGGSRGRVSGASGVPPIPSTKGRDGRDTTAAPEGERFKGKEEREGPRRQTAQGVEAEPRGAVEEDEPMRGTGNASVKDSEKGPMVGRPRGGAEKGPMGGAESAPMGGVESGPGRPKRDPSGCGTGHGSPHGHGGRGGHGEPGQNRARLRGGSSVEEMSEEGVAADVQRNLDFLRQQEDKPPEEEMLSVAVEGLLACFEDTLAAATKADAFGTNALQAAADVVQEWPVVPLPLRCLPSSQASSGPLNLHELQRTKEAYERLLASVQAKFGVQKSCGHQQAHESHGNHNSHRSSEAAGKVHGKSQGGGVQGQRHPSKALEGKSGGAPAEGHSSEDAEVVHPPIGVPSMQRTCEAEGQVQEQEQEQAKGGTHRSLKGCSGGRGQRSLLVHGSDELRVEEARVQSDIDDALAFLKSQEEQPSEEEVLNVAVGGLLTCMDDAISAATSARGAANVQKIVESVLGEWPILPYLLQNFGKSTQGCTPSNVPLWSHAKEAYAGIAHSIQQMLQGRQKGSPQKGKSEDAKGSPKEARSESAETEDFVENTCLQDVSCYAAK